MLQKDFWKNVAENKVDAETMKYAQERLDKMVTADAQKVIDREAVQTEILNFLGEMDGKKMTAKEIGEALSITTQKASYHLRVLAEAEAIKSFDGKPKEYSSLAGETETAEITE